MPMVETVRTRRVQRHPRETFMLLTALFAIFGYVSLCGLKTPAICLSFTGKKEDDDELLVRGWTV